MTDSTATTELDAEPLRQRIRLTYEKGEAIKFISHQDEFRLWERTLRRADLPLLYSQGFSPQPQIQFASPLGVGITGVREFVDITLSVVTPLADVAERIAQRLPPGVALHGIEETPLKGEGLQNSLIGADYTILIYAEVDEIAPQLLPTRISDCLQQTIIWRERERKGEKYIYNLRPLIFELSYAGYDAGCEEHRIFLRVQQRAGATGRPDEVVAALGLEDFARTLRRDRLYFGHNLEDVQTFSVYPVVSQEAIAHPDNSRRQRGRGRKGSVHHKAGKTGRSISERAGDEFV